jgi:glycosyltransferase involved in cell wall biosynthesis
MAVHLDASAPCPILFVENSIGLSGSTISLCTLVSRLDRRRFEPHVVVSRAEQAEYVRQRLGPGVPVAIVSPRGSLKARSGIREALGRLGGRSRVLERLGLRALALLELVLVTVPYALRLHRLARARRIRLIHQNNGFDLGALLLARALRAPLIGYQRGDEWDSWLVRRLAPRVDRYLANSQATKRSLVSLGVTPAKISVIYPPIDLEDFASPDAMPLSRAAFGVSAEAPSFGVLGQLQEWKGQKVFLRAARRVLQARPDARAWVIGGTPVGGEGYGRELRDLARALEIEDTVIFTGFVHDVPGVLGLLDVVVHASLNPEPFGRVIAEAMVRGKPVVASDAGGPREIIEHGRTGLLVPPGDATRLAEAILALLGDGALAHRLAESGRREASRRFSAELHARAVQDIYAEVLGSPPDPIGTAPEPEVARAADVTRTEVRR